MFIPNYLLPQRNLKDLSRYRGRWNSHEGRGLHKKILAIIREGVGEDLLNEECANNPELLESLCDLKGLHLLGERIEFADTDNFKGTDFSYARFHNCTFERARFYSVTLDFAVIQKCEFRNCVFAYTSFYGATLENMRFVNCDFVEYDRITNCDFREAVFENCFIPKALFFDCRFDEMSLVGNLKREPNSVWKETLDNRETAEIFKGIKEAYRAGHVVDQAQNYFLKERKAVTRFIRSRVRDKLFGYFLELTSGYGIRPLRVLLTTLLLLVVLSIPFMAQFGVADGFLLGSGAFFTFGANSDKLQAAGHVFRIWYVLEAFTGLCLIALFVTVLANKWFSER